ncbi:MAG: SpoIVB peptidase [Clostridiales bacterium]|nr:SpoIVB peptidase [Candidatus Cacconaster stercorequi]
MQRIIACLLALLLACPMLLPQAWASGGERTVIPSGKAVGIKLFADGVLVAAVSDLEVGGQTISPAEDCGLKEGDLILRINDEKVESTEHVQSILQANATQKLTLCIKRGDRTLNLSVTPVHCDDGVYRLGAWIRDSMAGIGTLTYYDPETCSYGALGHGITDVDTAKLMPLAAGSIMETQVKAVRRGEKGTPGELKGDFSTQRDVGTLCANTESGIFGTVADEDFLTDGDAVPVAQSSEIKTGKATILSTISGDDTQEYSVEIVKIYPCSQATRNMLVRVTDPRLLETTGGIVQGMSGSPILQNGKLVGAVTHVLVNDPTQGYGIFAENMLNAAG